MTRKLRVAAVQLRSGLEPAANRAQAMPLLREAATAGARFIATPENTLRLDRDRQRMLASVGPEEGDPELKAWARTAQELGVWLLLGSGAIAAGAGKVFNRSFLFNPDGRVAARYDKINLFDVTLGGGENYRESDTVEGGSKAVLVEGPMGAKIGLTICYDVRFAPLYAALARAGADIIAVPAAFTVPTGEAHWETLLRARAIETAAFVIAPAQGGRHEDGRATWGHSMIIDPWGKVLAKLDHDEPGVIVADLDLDQVAAARAKIPAWQGGRDFAGP
ncbi:MAG TPA: carbon-nitrogen hydrolase family protein [Vitreimonas sp.]|uniref:carbon-nitrogen hydrolase family protein n=1 Tax=Vitreimonas sp. TaxID=3069702 RepID=UPI002D22DBC5|nr:carbon-nitrogen hydrolase family protein [Vitreimonas sp.]HYD87522.1 carbon-nitrogen hydrolase family protein [Vitreimonas sp.]